MTIGPGPRNMDDLEQIGREQQLREAKQSAIAPSEEWQAYLAAKHALDRAAYALFQVKRMKDVPQPVIDFVREAHATACAAYDALPSHERVLMPEGLHPDTKGLVINFAEALAEKLRSAEIKYGYSNFWKEPDWFEECVAKLHEHMAKGDPRDVANYCAFLWFHGWPTIAAAPANEQHSNVAAPGVSAQGVSGGTSGQMCGSSNTTPARDAAAPDNVASRMLCPGLKEECLYPPKGCPSACTRENRRTVPLDAQVVELCGDSLRDKPVTLPSFTIGAPPSSIAALNLPDGLHPETASLVVRFAQALAEKLRKAEVKYGYSDFWKYDDWKEECQAKLLEHLAKGDPRDVANYCAFMWHHGWPTVAPSFGPIDGNPNNTALENWFPISAEELASLRRGVKCQYAEDVGMPESRCAVACQYAAKPVAWVRQSSSGGVSIYQGDETPRDGCRTVGDDGSGGEWIPIHAPRSATRYSNKDDETYNRSILFGDSGGA